MNFVEKSAQRSLISVQFYFSVILNLTNNMSISKFQVYNFIDIKYSNIKLKVFFILHFLCAEGVCVSGKGIPINGTFKKYATTRGLKKNYSRSVLEEKCSFDILVFNPLSTLDLI